MLLLLQQYMFLTKIDISNPNPNNPAHTLKTSTLIITQFGRIFKYFFFCLLHVLFVIGFFIKSKKTIDYFKEICYNCNNKNILILWRT